ncbi:hypothetical protein GC173_11515 [bacterium]|nr:hypothetical protein [bacterium]
MAEVPFAYGYENKVRDVTGTLIQIIQDSPAYISIIQTAARRAIQHKHEYPKFVSASKQTTTTASHNTSVTTIAVASKTPFRVNSIVRVLGPTGADHPEILRVTAISPGANEITVVRGYGSTTATAIASGSKLIVVNTPQRESSRASLQGDPSAPTLIHNFTEIFDWEAVVSNSQGPVHGIGNPGSQDPVGDAMNFQVSLRLIETARNMNSALIFGRAVERTELIPGTMGGLLQAHEGGNVVDAAAGNISEKLLNDAFQKCLEGGGSRLDTLLCGPTQARKITALYKDRLQILRQDQTLGNVIYQVQAGFPIGGYISTIVVDPAFPSSKISIHDRTQVSLVPFRAMTDRPSQAPGDDFVARRGVGEYTAEFSGIKETGCLISNLSTEIAA